MTSSTIQVGAGITLGAGVRLNPPVVSATGRNIKPGPDRVGFFSAVLNQNLAGWDYFAANGNNGSWTVTGDLGGGITSARIARLTHSDSAVFPVIQQGVFIPFTGYTFSGY